jgi:NAD(P)-dependent dehydrogenase (short-subunit alcohol dehydrogenase family)
MDWRDRNVMVTGGTGALGGAVVEILLAAGATCHVPCRSAESANGVGSAERLRTYVIDDLSDEVTVESLYARLSNLWASIHIAGGFAYGPIAEMRKSDLLRQIDINLTTAFLCCRGAAALMRRGGNGGRIVNVAARPALDPAKGSHMSAYTASKAAVAALTGALAAELAADGILVNAVAPSIMDTPANRESMPKADHARWPKVEEVAATILFLASADNTLTSGAVIPVYGRA